MTFGEHLEELRLRLIKSLIAIVVAFLICIFFLGKYIVSFASAPLIHALGARTSMERARQAPFNYDAFLHEVENDPSLSPELRQELSSLAKDARRRRLSLEEFPDTLNQNDAASPELNRAAENIITRLRLRKLPLDELLARVESLEPLPAELKELARGLARAATPRPFQITSPTEGFLTYIKVSLVAALFLSSPFVIYQIWKFVGAGLYSHERRYVTAFAPVSGFLFVTGTAFFYFLVSRYGLVFLFKVGPWQLIDPRMRISEYVAFFLVMCLVMGGTFQLPIIMVFLAKIGVIEPEEMASQRKIAYLASFILAAVLTPPDVITQVFLAFPIIVLFELGLFVARRV